MVAGLFYFFHQRKPAAPAQHTSATRASLLQARNTQPLPAKACRGSVWRFRW